MPIPATNPSRPRNRRPSAREMGCDRHREGMRGMAPRADTGVRSRDPARVVTSQDGIAVSRTHAVVDDPTLK